MKPHDNENNKIRLQVFLSHNGVCSRRAAMEVVQDGRVQVNGKVVLEPSFKVDADVDHIKVDGKLIRNKVFDYVLLHKKSGYIVTTEQRPSTSNVFKLLPRKYHHLSAVGRLDKNTEGLLLFTNDGDTAYKLTHPKFNVDKTYLVKVKGELSQKAVDRLSNGIVIEGKKTAKAKVFQINRSKDITEFKITIHEGRKRQIRIMCDKVGHKVVYLSRLVQGPLTLGKLELGAWRLLTSREIQQIKKIDIS